MALTLPARLLPNYRFALSFLACFYLLLGSMYAQGGGCVCTNCPQFMPDLFTGGFTITVENASNPTLGQNGQGVCGVVVHFDHTAICDLQMTLTSPSGQVVTLIGPIGQFCTSGGNAGTDWNVTFVPCLGPTNPDPGFSSTWNNNQNWGGGNSYSGSYYPYLGCLQNFTGPVNGVWTLTVTDGQANDTGNLYDYEIIFCDPSGINCFNCLADAGNLLQPDVSECQGSNELILNLPPTYNAPSVEPPSSDYSYAYIIAGPGGTILAIESVPDLSGYPAGNYTVCGLSYLSSNADDLPSPNGALTISQLNTQLSSNQPPFCGDITANCVGVTVKPLSPDVEDFATICAPQCVDFHGQSCCQTGTYTAQLMSANGCPYTATLYLTVNQPSFVNILETVCGGTCSTNPLFPNACSSGIYQETTKNIYDCDSTVLLNLTVLNINANIQAVPVLNCGQNSVPLNGTGSSIGPGTSYSWSGSNGGTIIGPGNMINANAGSGGDYALTVCRSLAGVTCCDTAMVTVISNSMLPETPIEIIGDSTICVGQTAFFSIASTNGATSYTWTVPPGVVIVSGQNTTDLEVQWNSPNPGNVCVTANNACGSTPSICFPVSIGVIPQAPAPLGDATVCSGSTATYSVPANPNVSYSWSLSGSNAIVAGQGSNQITVNWTTGSTDTVCVIATNACGASAPTCLPVNIEHPSAYAGVDTALCGNGITLQGTGMGAGLWSMLSGPGMLVFSDSSSATTMATASINGAYLLSWTVNTGLCADADTVQINLNPSPSTALLSLDCDPSNQNYMVSFQINGGTMPYSVMGGILNGNTFSSNPIASGQAYAFAVVDSNGCAAASIAGVFNCNCSSSAGQMSTQLLAACQGDTLTAQHLGGQNLDGNDTSAFVLHTLPGIALGSMLAQNANGIFGFQNGMSYDTLYYVSFVVGNQLNGMLDLTDSCLSVAPGQPIVFYQNPTTGAVTETCDGANLFYTVSFPILGGATPFQVNGMSLASSPFVSPPIASGSTYAFTITDAHGCTATSISGQHACNCSTAAGLMSPQTLTACEGDTISAQYLGGAYLDANDASAFVLHTAFGANLGTLLAENQTGSFVFQNGMTYGTTYYISQVVGNDTNGLPDLSDPCLSVSQGQPIVFFQIPTPFAGPDLMTCGLALDLQSQSSNFSGQWTQASGPALAAFNAPNNTFCPVTAAVYGNFVFVWTETNGLCNASDSVQAAFFPSPTVTALDAACNSTNTQYTITFDASMGTGPYSVSGLAGSFSGNSFTSIPLGNNNVYSFTLTDANGCASTNIAGSYNCSCATNAGTMLSTPAVFCANTAATATWNNDANLDGDDALQFILHDQAGSSVGALLATSNTPNFNLTAGLNTGVTYYISAIAGNGMAGSIDLTDPCLSIAPGAPIQWKPMPAASLTGDATICAGGSAALSVSGTGAYPLTVSYSVSGQSNNTVSLAGSSAASIFVSPTISTTYTLLSISDGTLPTCTSPLADAVSIVVNQPVSAGTAATPLDFCEGTVGAIPLASLLSGADAGGQWAEISAVPSTPGAFNVGSGSVNTSNLLPGTYRFRYSVSAQAPCPDDASEVEIAINANPQADAGLDQTINCNQLQANLGGPGTTANAAAYQWTNNGTPVGNTATLSTTNPGNYTLLVTNTFGCTASDVVSIVSDGELPFAPSIFKQNVRCNGEQNGIIRVDSIVSTHPPVLIALNNGVLGSEKAFTNLPPGSYTITLQDAMGCEWQSDTLFITQPDLLTVDLGSDLVINLGETALVQALLSVPVSSLDTLYWTPVLDSLHAGAAFQRFLPLQSQQISIQVVDQNGCIASSRTLVIVQKQRRVFIPNIINPSSNLNNALMVYGGPEVTEIETFQIFDRWGEKVFEAQHFSANDPTIRWEGKFKGEEAPPGVYTYYAVVHYVDGEKEVLKGDVTIVR